MKNKKLQIATYILAFVIVSVGVAGLVGGVALGITKSYLFIKNPLGNYLDFTTVNLSYEWAKKKVKSYAYNEQVPVEVVKDEIRKQAREFGLGENFMLQLADDESDFDNLAKNPISTACGVYQYVAATWQATESFKKKRIACTDYKANIREAMIDISNGEYHHWSESLD